MAYPYRMIRAFRGFRLSPATALYCVLFYGAVLAALLIGVFVYYCI